MEIAGYKEGFHELHIFFTVPVCFNIECNFLSLPPLSVTHLIIYYLYHLALL